MTPWGALWRLLLVAAWVWSMGVARNQGQEKQASDDLEALRAAAELVRQSDDDCATALATVAFLRDRMDAIEALTPEEVRAYVLKHLDAPLSIVPAGPGPEAA